MAGSKKQRLYEVLGVEPTATAQEIKKAYHRMALRMHPDKNPSEEREAANAKFLSLQRVYAILSDEEQRKLYDETGVEPGEEGEQFDTLYRYYRDVYAQVTVDDIEAHERAYRGSAEEERELKELYTRFAGNMDDVFCWLCCSRADLDSHRFMETLQAAVATGELKKSSKFEKWAKGVTCRPAPCDVLLRRDDEKDASASALVAAIRGRAQQSTNFVDALEAKYGGGGVGKKRQTGPAAGPSPARGRKARQ